MKTHIPIHDGVLCGSSNWFMATNDICRTCLRRFEKLVNSLTDEQLAKLGLQRTGTPIEIRGKLGTHPTDVFTIKEDIEGPPSIGDCVTVKSQRDPRCLEWTTVRVVEIKNIVNGPPGQFQGQFFYLELM